MTNRALPEPPREARYTTGTWVVRIGITVLLLGITYALFLGARKQQRNLGGEFDDGDTTTGRLIRRSHERGHLVYSYGAGGKWREGKVEVAPDVIDRYQRMSLGSPRRAIDVDYDPRDPDKSHTEFHGGLSPSGWKSRRGEVKSAISEHWIAHYEYEVRGKRYTGESRWYREPGPGDWPAVDGPIEVLYLPSHPGESKSAVESGFGPGSSFLGPPIIALLVSAVLIALFERRIRRMRNLYVCGVERSAKILDIEGTTGNWMNMIGGLLRAASGDHVPIMVSFAVRYSYTKDRKKYEVVAKLSEKQAKGLEVGATAPALLSPDGSARLLREVASVVAVEA